MLFNSLSFVVFFLCFYIIYLLLQKNYKYQNIYLLLASYYFYSSWNWKFSLLILASTVIDYFCSMKIVQSEKNDKKFYLFVSLCSNLGILFFFKYFNFFTKSFVEFFSNFGIELDAVTVNVILPVGISFYTFQTMSYTIDVFRGRILPEKNFWNFSLYVSFFPQLVAGPIERASSLLPQIAAKRSISLGLVERGLWLIAIGFFKKVVIADNFAIIADEVFNSPESYSGVNLLIGVYAFTWQIYGDFSGYSDIARGLSNLMGFDLIENFKIPYISRSPSEFWKRWHISLSQWLRDYLYIPLGGNKGGEASMYRNLILTMLLGGLWHGAAWNFILWGMFHGIILVIYRYFRLEEIFTLRFKFLSWLVFFHLTCFGWILFRVNNLSDLKIILLNLFSSSTINTGWIALFIVLLPLLIYIQFFKVRENNLYHFAHFDGVKKYIIYFILFTYIFIAGQVDVHEFIYFQF